ncbi:MAG: cupin domain-containing protein [Candidatus Omnitrophica bacterium]|nr:cupin domain-containing protein [Candidatus Omnitrophota bacterium]MBU1925029.1 cupin domain-containing protein [Candidatus Omnitrophota bacterium]
MEISVKKPTPEELDELGIKNWSPWECDISIFDWEYSDRETAYVYAGKVKVRTDSGEVSIEKGDLVTFPKGLKCTWKVEKPLRKVYKFG